MSTYKMTKKQQERKAYLDQLMREYYYEKNEIDSILEFLAVMFAEYHKIMK